MQIKNKNSQNLDEIREKILLQREVRRENDKTFKHRDINYSTDDIDSIVYTAQKKKTELEIEKSVFDSINGVVNVKSNVSISPKEIHFNYLDSEKAAGENLRFTVQKLYTGIIRKQHSEIEKELRETHRIKAGISPALRASNELSEKRIKAMQKNKTVQLFYGQFVLLSALKDKNEIRYAHWMRLATGLDQIREEDGLKTYIVTIKVPQWLVNKKLTIKESTDFLNSQWKNASKLETKNFYGMAVIEPHKNGQPHLQCAIVCTEETIAKIKKTASKSKAKWHFQLNDGENSVQKTFDYLLKTIKPKSKLKTVYNCEGIRRFKLLGKLHGVSNFWWFSRGFQEEQLIELAEGGHASHMPTLALQAKRGQAYEYLRNIYANFKPKPVHLNRIATDYEYFRHSKIIKILGFTDKRGNAFSATLRPPETSNTCNSSKDCEATKYMALRPVLYLKTDYLYQDVKLGYNPIANRIFQKECHKFHRFSVTFTDRKKKLGKNKRKTILKTIKILNPFTEILNSIYQGSYYNLSKAKREHLELNDPTFIADSRFEGTYSEAGEIQYHECMNEQAAEYDQLKKEKQRHEADLPRLAALYYDDVHPDLLPPPPKPLTEKQILARKRELAERNKNRKPPKRTRSQLRQNRVISKRDFAYFIEATKIPKAA